ncbi:tryptophan synthase subunit alpha, partial [Streptomyces sp. SID7982]|nr:tryptophan synthase subunit alpha [Streptomyces sp. SID7982]
AALERSLEAGSDPVDGYRSFLADLGRPLSTRPKEDTRAHP